MGQYYKPIVLDDFKKSQPKAFIYSHDYDNGLKLMEHSWLGNNFVNVVETLLTKGNDWYKKPIVWAGDYAEPEKGCKTNLYGRCNESNNIKPIVKMLPKRFKYVVNHDTKQFVDKTKVPVSDVYTWTDEKTGKKKSRDYIIHPLPLLTCEGNGQGGGDFRGENPLIGTWSRNRISIESSKPKGYSELIFDLKE